MPSGMAGSHLEKSLQALSFPITARLKLCRTILQPWGHCKYAIFTLKRCPDTNLTISFLTDPQS
jgi:hypothetical protein